MNFSELAECYLVNIFLFCNIKDLFQGLLTCKKINESLVGKLARKTIWSNIPTGITPETFKVQYHSSSDVCFALQFEDIFCLTFFNSKYLIFKENYFDATNKKYVYEVILKSQLFGDYGILCINRSKIVSHNRTGLFIRDYAKNTLSERIYIGTYELHNSWRVQMNDFFLFVTADKRSVNDEYSIVKYDFSGKKLQVVFYEFTDVPKVKVTNKVVVVLFDDILLVYDVISFRSPIFKLNKLSFETTFQINSHYIVTYKKSKKYIEVRSILCPTILFCSFTFPFEIDQIFASNSGLLYSFFHTSMEFKPFLFK